MYINDTLADANWNSPYSVVAQVIVWIIMVILSLETIIGNAMVIFAYRIERNISKQVSNRYIVSLAISDLIIGIEGFPLFTVYVLNGERWPLGSIACETWLFLDYTLCLVSILTVLLITADRYLSVCHTAKYLKWQSPTKTQLLIILSWLIPAVIFGIMIYGWRAMTGQSTRMSSRRSMSGAECSAPFLSNPYVNMGMYVVYYWTTLVAMLILYKGIHQAAKNLEKKAKAKERRHIALILSQRLGTQVGVSLMLQSRAEKEREEAQRDSGYQTTTAAASGTTESEQNLGVIEEERSGVEMFSRRESNESYFPVPNPTAENSRRCSEMERVSLLSHEDTPRCVSRVPGRHSLRSNCSRCSISEKEDNQSDKNDSLRMLFNDEELGSVLNFKEPLKQVYSNNDCDSTSVIVKQTSGQFKKNRRMRSSRKSGKGTPRRIAQLRQTETPLPTVQVEEPNINEQTVEVEVNRSDRWVASMKRRIAKALTRRNTRRERRSSTSSDDSSSEAEPNNARSTEPNSRLMVPQLTVSSEQRETPENDRLAPETKSDTFLSASGVSRKISSISTAITRERVISSIFAPISVFNRGRKQTKAEKRAHKAFRTITFIVGFFAILWSPYYIMATVYGFCKGECIPSFLYTLSYYMCYLNSSGNPFAYALANRQFRSAFLRMLRGNFNKIA